MIFQALDELPLPPPALTSQQCAAAMIRHGGLRGRELVNGLAKSQAEGAEKRAMISAKPMWHARKLAILVIANPFFSAMHTIHVINVIYDT